MEAMVEQSHLNDNLKTKTVKYIILEIKIYYLKIIEMLIKMGKRREPIIKLVKEYTVNLIAATTLYNKSLITKKEIRIV